MRAVLTLPTILRLTILRLSRHLVLTIHLPHRRRRTTDVDAVTMLLQVDLVVIGFYKMDIKRRPKRKPNAVNAVSTSIPVVSVIFIIATDCFSAEKAPTDGHIFIIQVRMASAYGVIIMIK